MNLNKIRGLVVPIITPRKNKKIDLISLKKLIDFLIENKVDAIFILGTTGEFQYLNLKEKMAVIKTSIDTIKKKVPLLAGISSDTLGEMQKLIEITNKLMVDAVVLAPLFGKGDAGKKINITIQKSNQPILLYNNPAICGGRNLDINIIRKFLTNKKIIGIKDSSGNKEYFGNLLELSSKDFGVFQGTEEIAIDSLRRGARGLVSGSANIYPAEFKSSLSQKSEGAQEKISEYIKEIISLSPNYIYGIKTKLAQRGLIETNELFH